VPVSWSQLSLFERPQQPSSSRQVQSVITAKTNGTVIATAAELWIRRDDVVVDVTYGRGSFWSIYRPEHLVAHDVTVDGVDFRQLPEDDGSVDVVVFDPPYTYKGGRHTSTIPDFDSRYGLRDAPRTLDEFEDQIARGLTEARRIMRPDGGRLLVKCMDQISSGRFVTGHHNVVAQCLALGLEQLDEFVHVRGLGPQPSGRRQVHSRRAHSFLCVFEKGWRRR
jgi:hypothetical protein